MTPSEWIEPRLQGAPPELAAAIRSLLGAEPERSGAEPPSGVPDVLVAAAIDGFDGVLEPPAPLPRSREVALRLLAADALLTYAFEAAADLDTGVDELAERIGPAGTFGALLVAAGDEGRS